MAELKQYELIKTIIYKVDTKDDYAEYKLEVYKGNNGFKGIIYRKDCYRMLARYDENFINIDKNLFTLDNNFNRCLINYDELEENIINNFYIELEKIGGHLN
ncbi:MULTISPECIES: hypothetical protein [unclassified Gilliamella]|uniref:hypothetical protein n=1 Tax=unclassified Gilliamella TaxID=2685620 RepID=UPI00080E0753|nr:hypothetical protein [Gilliamella apicola]OCG20437.1 hypothetical protein A9G23_06305 [Gilliamella apicola]OCG20965.1 hypothetical protein A9G22_10260 [Gilliamella apicola]